MPVTLAIDYGSRHIGVALVSQQDGKNTPLFAGTLSYDTFSIRKKVTPRSQIRRARRTRKTKKARLRRLEAELTRADFPEEIIPHIVRFCRRRGYKSLWEDNEVVEPVEQEDEEEILYRFSREEFFRSLEKELESLLDSNQRNEAFRICERVLNRKGDRSQEIRPIRIDNRGTARCAWEGCNNVTPRRHNCIRDPLAQFVFLVFNKAIAGSESRRQEVDGILDRVSVLAKRYRNASGHDPAKERKALLKKVRSEIAPLKEYLKDAGEGTEPNKEEQSKTWQYIKANIENLVKRQTGRNRYCREHSAEFIEHILSGRPVPFKPILKEKDIRSRREEILFSKLWRYIEARIIPLAGGRVDRVVVERNAFDLLAGSRKQRQKLGDETLEEMYQYGPRYGFDSNLQMLKEEFGGLCAYCGREKRNLVEREHILPRSSFLFDSYLNVVPACRTCNSARKGKMMPTAMDLKIHENAYLTYENYLRKKYRNKPPHLFHTVKKGILNLMRQPDRMWEAEAYLGLIANQFAESVQTQRGPRPLARFLCEKIRKQQGDIPEVKFHAGRHTDVWRCAAYPDFDKVSDKQNGGIINHALDAVILASDLPSVSHLEARRLRTTHTASWRAKVRDKAPEAGPDGVPVIPSLPSTVKGFEEVLPGDFIKVDLACLNWKRKNASTHQQEPFSWSRFYGCPSKRIKANELSATLAKAKSDQGVKRLVEKIAHPNLRTFLLDSLNGQKYGQAVSGALRHWLRKSLKNSLSNSNFSDHPGDKARREDLHKFAEGESDEIPSVIGVKLLSPDRKGNVDLERRDPRTGNVMHRYMTLPSIQTLILAYGRDKKNRTDRKKPLLLEVRQNDSVKVKTGRRNFGPVPPGPLQGRVLGDKKNSANSTPGMSKWREALKSYLQSSGIVEYGFVSQGSVLVYKSGKERFIRNFSPDYGFKTTILKDVIGIKRSPLSGAVQTLNRLS